MCYSKGPVLPVAKLYHFHKVQRVSLTVTPFLGSESHGIFATRAPTRPNPIGLSIVRLERIEGNILHVESLDILDGTPLLDVKPYIPDFDSPPEARIYSKPIPHAFFVYS